MIETKKDRRDHKYGRVHRKNRELKNVIDNKLRPFYEKYMEESSRYSFGSKERDRLWKWCNALIKENSMELEELWKKAGINWKGGYEEFCRFLRYHGHSNHGYIHADFLKRRQKDWDKRDRNFKEVSDD